ncbi:FAD/FMN-containing dehydrogenase [Flavobacterium sp. CF108]|uniref:FAD-binding oxidoreductase n=1 Tax=unclassified Flavobacterium TaxID=196869 RepID=UPI0008C551FF|nr:MULTISPECIES: FAD-binding oxidoreductase [unclassified Flavobacterium]SEO69457.1 FAD/FMN-containing dehydrogenase [Flavobacterium sp. fv08]SHH90432.1 FAD/FMN-containing dehydrogenase [Flavobacterium sp. CF108]
MIETAIQELVRELSGYVLQPCDSEYEDVIKIDNGRIQFRPRLIIFPAVVEDVRLGLKFAITNDLPFSIKGGGHSAAGYCLNEGGVVIAMKNLNRITFNPKKETVTAEMGVIWYDVYKFMQLTNTGLIPVGGGCPTVAPPGFMLGGGYSFVSRSYGMSIDNLESLKIVTPDGELRHIGVHSTSAEDIDLFWACSGGGGGNFGIVVEMEMRVRKPLSKKMLVGQIRYPLEMAEDVLGYYNEWVEEVPDAMAVYGFMGNQKDLIDKTTNVKVLGLTPVFNGDGAEGIELLQGLLKLKPINADLFNMTLPDWEFYNGYTTRVAGRSSYIRSTVLPKGGMNNKVAKVIIESMSKAPSAESFAVWTHAGGAIENVASDATAYVHRNSRFIPEVKAIWDLDKPGDTLKNVEWAYEFFERLADAGKATGAYVNYIDPLQHNWAKQYYGSNYKRLLEIKKKVDPNNYFNFQQSVGSPFNPTKELTDISPINRTRV